MGLTKSKFAYSPQVGATREGHRVPQVGVTSHPITPHLDAGHHLVEIFVKHKTVAGGEVSSKQCRALLCEFAKHLEANLYCMLLHQGAAVVVHRC